METRRVEVESLAEQLLALYCNEEPVEATLLGVPGYDAVLADLSTAGEERLAAGYEALATAAAAELATVGLAEEDRRTVEFVAHYARVSGAATRLGTVEWQVSDRWSAPAAALTTLLPQVPLDSEARRGAYRLRLCAIPGYLAEAAVRHRRGVERGRTPVARLVRACLEHLDRTLADASLAGIARDEDAGVAGVAGVVVRPALAAYREAVAALLPVARADEHAGICYLPGGEADYAALVRRHTGGARSPLELHALGLEVSDRLAEEYAVIGERALGTSRREEIFARLREDAGLRYASAEQMLADATAAVRRAEAAAPRWFGTVPAEACVVEPVPPTQQAGSPPAYYLPPALDGSRPGTYFLNTSHPAERQRFAAEAIAFHEAVPGHHFQLSIAQQTPGLPAARRLLYDTAGAEGWGLYAERLAQEMGLYSDDLARLGMLSADSWRAARLVVDTGLHALGWTRAQAVSWFAENAPLARVDIESEVDRYIAGPGQALGYMVGRIELEELRSLVAARLGDAFEVRSFHDAVLAAGPMPLPVLRGAIERWSATS